MKNSSKNKQDLLKNFVKKISYENLDKFKIIPHKLPSKTIRINTADPNYYKEGITSQIRQNHVKREFEFMKNYFIIKYGQENVASIFREKRPTKNNLIRTKIKTKEKNRDMQQLSHADRLHKYKLIKNNKVKFSNEILEKIINGKKPKLRVISNTVESRTLKGLLLPLKTDQYNSTISDFELSRKDLKTVCIQTERKFPIDIKWTQLMKTKDPGGLHIVELKWDSNKKQRRYY